MDEATRRFEESMEVLTRAWTSIEPFDHRGEFWSFNDLTVQPKPVQRPHPPVYVAASGSDSVARVVRNDWNLLVGQAETQEQVGRQVEFYRDALAEVELPYTADRVVVARAMYAAETTEQARREAEIPFMWFKQTGQEVSAPPGRRADLLPEEFAAYRSRYSPDARFDYAALCDDVMLFGSPDHIAERIGLLRDSGVENLIFFVNFGGIEHQKVLDSLELFAAEVMPQFAD
jgi:alkanesulfonate monooxygenase SsuD/methylene tetrahydromethanopterin reductase-like flavin-dependent oxidoreductase (luciferase family)